MRSHQSIDQSRHSTNILPDLYTEHAHQPELKEKQKGIIVFRSEKIFQFLKASWDGWFQKSIFRNGLWKKDRNIHMNSLYLHLHFANLICELQTYRISQTLSTCQSFNKISALIRGKIRIYKLHVEFAGLWNSICLQFKDRFCKLQMRAKRIHADAIELIRSFFHNQFRNFLKPSISWFFEKFENCLQPENKISLLFYL